MHRHSRFSTWGENLGGCWNTPTSISSPIGRREKRIKSFESSAEMITKLFQSIFRSSQNVWPPRPKKWSNFRVFFRDCQASFRKTGQPNMKSSSTGPGRHFDGCPPEEETDEEKGQAAPSSVSSGMSDHRKTGQPKMKSRRTGSGQHLDG